MEQQDHRFNTAPDLRALCSYLRFSYPAETQGLFGEAVRSFAMPQFCTEPARTKEEYLETLSQILDGIFQTERTKSDAAFLSSGVDSSLIAFGIRAKKRSPLLMKTLLLMNRRSLNKRQPHSAANTMF